MQKRKFKINVLDITIVILIICAVAALLFRDTINEFFTKPNVVVVDITVTASPVTENEKAVYKVGNTVTIESDNPIQAVITKVTVNLNKVTAPVSLNGYKRFGRYYMENGSPLTAGGKYKAVIAGNSSIFSIVEVQAPQIAQS